MSETAQPSLASLRAPAGEHVDVLRRRAASLARVTRIERTATTPALRFRLGGEEYVVPATCVLQVAVLRELAPLPGAPAPIFGITHWRGIVLTVLDLRVLLGVRTRGLTDMSRLIVIEARGHAFGVLADAVLDIVDLDMHRLSPLPRGDGTERPLLRGMTDDGAFVIDAEVLRTTFGEARHAPQTTGRGG